MGEAREKAAFAHGYVLACCNIANLHNEPVIAADILAEAGITEAEIAGMDLSDYDAMALEEIRRARGEDPIKEGAPL